jgi:hypothetical protein
MHLNLNATGTLPTGTDPVSPLQTSILEAEPCDFGAESDSENKGTTQRSGKWSCCQCDRQNPTSVIWCKGCKHYTINCLDCFSYEGSSVVHPREIGSEKG